MVISKELQERVRYLRYVIDINNCSSYVLRQELERFGVSISDRSDLDKKCLRDILNRVLDRMCEKYEI